MGDFNLPRWAGPAVGVGVGAILGAFVSIDGKKLSIEAISIGAVLGLVAGVLISLLDRPRHATDLPPPTFLGNEGSPLIANVFALLSLLLFCAPIVGFGVAMIALSMNYRSSGWTRPASLIAAILATIVTLAFFAVLLLAK